MENSTNILPPSDEQIKAEAESNDLFFMRLVSAVMPSDRASVMSELRAMAASASSK